MTGHAARRALKRQKEGWTASLAASIEKNVDHDGRDDQDDDDDDQNDDATTIENDD